MFEPRRRQDVDLIFMVAFPPQARQLKPILNYQYATAIPVMGTSHLYSGTPNRERDEDLNGVPVRGNALETEPVRTGTECRAGVQRGIQRYETLIALALTPITCTPRLTQLQRFPNGPVFGVTGTLSLDDGRRVHRELTWATIVNGMARDSEGLPAAPSLP